MLTAFTITAEALTRAMENLPEEIELDCNKELSSLLDTTPISELEG
jgi:hypothetical protein